jgi:amino acid adenylation domain-containing protein/non-ribosomal peptide synthase protein (TIGR01720 family)
MNSKQQSLAANLEHAKQYWSAKLAGEIGQIELTLKRPSRDGAADRELDETLPDAVTARLRTIGKNQDLAIYVLLVAVLKITLFKYTGQSDVITASPPLSSSAGSFNSVLPLRDQLTEAMSFKEILLQVKQTTAEAYQNQHYPLAKLLKELGYDHPAELAGVLALMEGVHQSGGASTGPALLNSDLTMRFRKTAGRIDCNIQYNSGQFEPEVIKKLFECYCNVLATVLTNVDLPLSRVELVSETEKQKLLVDFNHTSREFSENVTIHELFAAQALKTPENTAVSCTVDLTEVYAELNLASVNAQTGVKIGKCCFEANPYVVRRDVAVSGTTGRFTLLKSHTHQNVIVNGNVLQLLSLFRQGRNLETLRQRMKSYQCRFITYTIPHDDILEIALQLENNRLEIFDNQQPKAFWGLIKLLYHYDLIRLVDYHRITTDPGGDWEVGWVGEEPLPAKAQLDRIFLPDAQLRQAEVLLLGDTPGTATVGLLYLASYLRRNGYSAYCQFTESNVEYDAFKKNLENLVATIQPRIVGVSMKWFAHSSRALETCKIIKQFRPKLQIVVGGNTASYYYDRVIHYDDVDYVIKGDGELPFLKICQGADYLPNCCYKKNGAVIDNPITYVHDESNSQDIYLSHLEEILISKQATLFGTFYIYTNKGCVMNCLYCAACRDGMVKTFNRRQFSLRGIDAIRNDLLVTKDDVTTFMFDFESANESLLEFCRNIWDGIDLSSHFCTFCNVIPPSKELLEYVNRTYQYVYWELDICSLSERHRKHLQALGEVKPQPTDAEILAFLAECDHYPNAEVRINLIAGLPFYTEADMAESNRMLRQIMHTYSCFSNLHWGRLHAQPGAPVAHNAAKYDMVSSAESFEDFIKFSAMNMDSRPSYPYLETLFYPYVYYQDEKLNSMVSGDYLETNRQIEIFKNSKKENLIVVESLTYAELDRRSNQVARYLRKRMKGTPGIVAIMAKYSVGLIIGMLGVLKSGGAYLPLDPDYPAERIDYILAQSGTDILLTQTALKEKIGFSGPVIDLDDESIFSEDGEKLTPAGRPRDLAYIIYTSGSTGQPKGVMIEHRSLVNLMEWRITKYGFTQHDRTLQLIAPSFDGFGSNFYSSLLSGGNLILPDEGHWRDFDFARRLIRELRVTNLSVVPAIYRAILDGAAARDLESLRFVVLAAEQADPQLVSKSRGLNAGLQLINEYGPTENTITTTSFMALEPDRTGIIGSPVANNRVYILNPNGALLPVGVPGELCIAGAGLARGYLNQPRQNREKFVNDPFDQGQRMYKTGDRARWLSDGQLEFLGRIDRQVKIKGYRVELNEIEARIRQNAWVKEAAVGLKEGESGRQILCAYTVADRALTEQALREYLRRYLPDYMVPAQYVFLERLPLNHHGKLDRKALESIAVAAVAQHQSEAPRNELEAKIAVVWQEILGVATIGINDNFFALGGDSIKAIQIAAQLQQHQIRVAVKDIFQFANIKELSPLVGTTVGLKAVHRTVTGRIDLSPIQTWFFERKIKVRHHFNQAVMLYAQAGFEEPVVRKAFTRLIEHHDALRMVYRLDGGTVEQYNRGLEGPLFDLVEFDFTNEPDFGGRIAFESEKLQRSIDLETGPLVKLGLFKTGRGDHLLIVIHHLVVDGISWRIILHDFAALYDNIIKGRDPALGPKSLSFKEWVARLMNYAGSPKLLQETVYWDRVAQIELTPFPKDRALPDNQFQNEKTLRVEWHCEETQHLLKGVNHAYHTEINDLLLAALGMAVKEWSGIERFAVSLEGHGREPIIPETDIANTVGWFTTEYPVVLDLGGSDSPAAIVKTVKETLRQVPDKGIGYGILKYLARPAVSDGAGRRLTPEIGFNYLGQFDQDIQNPYFTFSPLTVGTSIDPQFARPHVLEIVGMIVNGRLVMNFKYCEGDYREKRIERLVTAYQTHLRALITHCLQVKQPELTPSDFGDPTLTLTELDKIIQAVGTDLVKVYPLSPLQEGMLYHALTERGADPHFEQTMLSIKGDLDIEIYEESFNRLFNRYEILRTAFVCQGLREPRQVVLKERRQEIYFEEITAFDPNEIAAYCEQFINRDRARGFDLTREALIRTAIIKTGADSFRLIWDFHHIIMDGWCLGVVLQEFFSIYNSLKAGRELVLEPVTPYSDYIHWLQEQDKEAALDYWQNSLRGYEQQASLPKLSEQRPERYLRREIRCTLDEGLTKSLVELARRHQVTLNIVMQCLWGVLLQRYNNTTDVVFGTVVSGRPSQLPGIEKMAGLFINTIPVRVKCAPEKAFNELLRDVQRDMLVSEEYHYAPLAEIQALTALQSGLIDNILAFENYPVQKDEPGATEGGNGFAITAVEMFDRANYDLNLVIGPGKELLVRLIFNEAVYDGGFVRAIAGHLKEAAYCVVGNPAVPVKDIRILAPDEVRAILALNQTGQQYEQDLTIRELFEEQVAQTGKNSAVVFENRVLSYGELNEAANKLAWLLKNKGAGTNSIIGVMTGNTADTVIGLLAILKTGGIYLPLDPGYPQKRIEYMLEDSGVQLLLAPEGFQAGWGLLENFRGEVVTPNSGAGPELEAVNPGPAGTPDDVAYVIYTSGSTGMPKGVMIKNRGIANLREYFRNKLRVTANDHILQFASISFDASVWEIFMALLTGATLYIASKEIIGSYSDFAGFLAYNKITIATLPPSYLTNLGPEDVKTVQKLIVAGSVTPPSLLQRFAGHLEYINAYGPTETTICATTWSSKSGRPYGNAVPIGKPIGNTKVYIVNEHQKLQPVMVAGELCVAGVSLAQGYLNRPELTKRKFVVNPLNNEIIYRTGDYARLLPDGNIEFLGRSDHQVKLRGFRIELGEIENQALAEGTLTEAVAQVREATEDNKYICLYFTAPKPVAVAELRRNLAGKLPDYMVPSYFLQLPAMPLTPNGKIDRKKFPEPVAGSRDTGPDATPGNEVELKLAEVWSEVLSNPAIGVNDNFFEAGGNSLLLMKLYARLSGLYPGQLKITDLFNHPTIAKMAEFIAKNTHRPSQRDSHALYKALKMPEHYFTGKNLSKMNQAIRARIQGELLAKLREAAARESANTQEILLALYSFLLSGITDNRRADLQAAIVAVDRIVPLSVDFANPGSLSGMVKMVRQSYQEGVANSFQWDREHRDQSKIRPADCRSLYYDPQLIRYEDYILNSFDFTLGVSAGETAVNLLFRFNSGRLKKEKMKVVFDHYLGLVKQVISNKAV